MALRQGASDNVFEANTVVGAGMGGVMLNGGSKNIIENNILVGAPGHQSWFNNYEGNATGNTFQRNIVYSTEPESCTFSYSRFAPEFVACDHNLIWHGGRPPAVSLSIPGVGLKRGPWSLWQEQGLGKHSVVADPLFVNPEADDYRLKPDSPAFKLGFKPIPVGKIGLAGAPRRPPAWHGK